MPYEMMPCIMKEIFEIFQFIIKNTLKPLKRITRKTWNSNVEKRRFFASVSITNSIVSKRIDSTQGEALDKEICLLVDEKDKFIGTATKRNCHKVAVDGSLLLHRAFSVFLFNQQGDMLLQRRSSQKVTYPCCISNACCSHQLYIDDRPEDVITAARRRLNYELGISLNQTNPERFTYVTRFHYQHIGDGVWGEHEISHLLVFQGDVNIEANPNEVSEYYFVAKNEFNSFITSFTSMTPWFNILQRHKLRQWWDNLHRIKEIAEPEKIYNYLNEKP